MDIRLCVICSTPLKYHQKFCCSHKCLGAHQKNIGNLTIKCAFCSKEFTVPKHRKQKTCSKSCGHKLLHRNDPPAQQNFECDYCKKTFVEYPSKRRGKSTFCSRECSTQYLRKYHVREGKNNPSWKGGRYSYKRYGPHYLFDRNHSLHMAVKLRDREICRLCSSNKNLHVHHADFDGKNHSMNNLITLCASCHRKVEVHKIQTAYLIVNVQNTITNDQF